MLSDPKQFPHISIPQRRKRSDFQLQKMVLRRIKVDGVDAAWLLEAKRQDVVAGGSDGEDNVIGLYFKEACIGTIVFPGEGINIRVIKTAVLFKCFVVVNAPMVVLVPREFVSRICGE